MTSLAERRTCWSGHSGALALMDDRALGALVDRTHVDGWGASVAATLPDGSPVFVKRLPLTEVEAARGYSTRNHFQLPVAYQYGVGSAGFGVWRELATHVRTTGWVMDGSCEGFPMLLHHRVMRRPEKRARRGPAQSWVESDEYVQYWNSSKRIGSFIAARAAASHELWLVLEHVPHRLFEWLHEHQSAIGAFIDELVTTIRFLHGHGLFHFDAHYGNVVTDGTRPLLTDFGLATDLRFDLSEAERDFVERHRHYDFGETIYGAGNALHGFLLSVPKKEQTAVLRRCGVEQPIPRGAAIDALVANVETLASEGLLSVTPEYAATVVRYRPVIQFMTEFFRAMQTNNRKNTFFDDARLAGLLADAGVEVE